MISEVYRLRSAFVRLCSATADIMENAEAVIVSSDLDMSEGKAVRLHAQRLNKLMERFGPMQQRYG